MNETPLQLVRALVQRQRMGMVLACARLCKGRKGWIAAGLLLELWHQHSLQVHCIFLAMSDC